MPERRQPKTGRFFSLLLLALFSLPAQAQNLTQWTEEGIRITPGEDSTPVLLPNGSVRLYYSNDTGVVSQTAPDGLNFTPDPGVRLPLMPYPNSVAAISGVRIVPLPNGQWRMFYYSNPDAPVTDAGPGIGSAISSDGLNFTIEPHWRLAVSAVNLPQGGQFSQVAGAIVSLPNGTYRLYFNVAFPQVVGMATLQNGAIWSASSTDMINWTVDPGVRVGHGSALGGSALHPDAIVNGDGSVTLFYWDDSFVNSNGQGVTGIKFATSADGLNFPSEAVTSLNSGTPNCQACFYGDPSVYVLPSGGLRAYFNTFSGATNTSTLWSATSDGPAPGQAALVSSVLPSSRSVAVGGTATAFATMINFGLGSGFNCSIAPVASLPATFSYQTTNPSTNAVTGSPNTPVTIAAGAAQSFVIALSPTAPIAAGDVSLDFSCQDSAGAPIEAGLNTLYFSASTTPTPDIVALAATASNDGTLHIPGSAGANAFAVATVNLGAGSSITATANTGSASLPLSVSLCETDPTSGQCITPVGSSVTATINANATPTFAIFGQATGSTTFSPAANRIFVQFADPGGTVRGSTSVAVTSTQ